jgi:hypothetical protein
LIRDRENIHPGSEIRKKFIPDSESRGLKKLDPGSRSATMIQTQFHLKLGSVFKKAFEPDLTADY